MPSWSNTGSERVTATTDSSLPDEAALFEDAACGLLRTREDGKILRVNRTFCGWLGEESDALVGKRRFQDLLTIGGRIFHQTHWAPLLQMQGSISEVKLELAGRDDTTTPVIVNAVRRTVGGVVIQDIALYVARDRDRFEQELVRTQKRLEQLVAEATTLHEEARVRFTFAEQMVGIVSHDLRNPLSTIRMGSAILLRGDLPPGQQRTLGRITRATERATHLIEDLLDFTQARLGTGLKMAAAPIDLEASVGDAVQELALLHAERRIVHLHSGDVTCTADAHRIAQLVGNLVSNALTYGKPGGAVTVTSSVADARVSIAVHNEGEPIPEDRLPGLFHPMTRGPQPAGGSRSVGLGLFIVGEIAKAHGGVASVVSTSAAGTTFAATFPRAP